MNINFDKFNNYEIPNITLCTPSSSATIKNNNVFVSHSYGKLNAGDSLNLKLNFNAPNEISFEINSSNNSKGVFEAVATKSYIFLSDIGFFVITECDSETDYSNGTDIKSIKASSCDYELNDCSAPYVEDGTYPFVTDGDDVGIIDMCAECAPKWTFSHDYIDVNLKSLQRYFSGLESDNLYSFFTSNLQDMYDCYFEFDTITRKVYAYAKANYANTHSTDIHLSHTNLLNKFVRQGSDSDIYTALKVSGDNDLSISCVNPIGGSVIYDFTYRLDSMSSALKTAVQKWKARVNASKSTYKTLNLSYYTKQDELKVLELDENNIQQNLDKANENLNNAIASNDSDKGSVISSLKTQIAGYQSSIYTKKQAINTKQTEIDSLKSQIDTINEKCSLSITAKDVGENLIFTADLLAELSNYISTSEYSDENITQTDEMTHAEVFTQVEILMTRAEEQLEKICTENFKFTVDTQDFVFNKQFSHFTKQLKEGCVVWAETNPDKMEQYHLSSAEIDFKEKKTALEFSNKYNKYDMKSIFDDVFGSVKKSANKLQYITSVIEDQDKRLKNCITWIDGAMTLTASHVLKADTEETIIDNCGYWGRVRQYDGSGHPLTDQYGNFLFDNEQIKIIHNGVYITNDNWSTVATAIGKIYVYDDAQGNPVYKYGVIGDVIVGKLIVGESLIIQNTDGDNLFDNSGFVNESLLQVDGKGIKTYVGEMSLANFDGISDPSLEWEYDNYDCYESFESCGSAIMGLNYIRTVR